MSDLSPVNCRLFTADVAELKRRAAQRGIKWQTLLRHLVREALRRDERTAVG